MTASRRRLLHGLLCAALLLGCRLQDFAPQAYPLPTHTAQPTSLPEPTARPSATPAVPDSGWLPLREGMARRMLNISSEDGEWVESVTILRLDPAHFRFDVAYAPGAPQSLPSWQAQSGALLVVNGGFFTEANEATGLLISGGRRSGRSYEGFGGMFAVTEQGPEVRWLGEEPYEAQEPLLAALQAFPMLLTPGGAVGIVEDDDQRARRTVVAQDDEGRILFLVAAQGHFTLYGLSRFLAASDMGLDRALNLDGGASSGILLAEPRVYVPALSLLPAVIVVDER